MTATATPTLMQTVRSDCGNARATHHPEWSSELPWVTYIQGTAGRHFATDEEAVAYLRRRGFTFYGSVPKPVKIGITEFCGTRYDVYRQAGNPEDANPHYYGMVLEGYDPPYCAFISVASMFKSKGWSQRTEVMYLPGYLEP